MAAPQSGFDAQPVRIPKLNRDPIWSLRPWPVSVTIQSTEWTIPALVAADWLAVLMVEDLDPDEILPGLLEPEDAERMEELILTEGIDLNIVYESYLDIIERVSARHWWVALRLIWIARDQWHILGPDLISKGVDATQLSLAAWLDCLTVTILQNMKREQVTMFTMQLEAPPVGEQSAEEEMTMSADAFMALG